MSVKFLGFVATAVLLASIGAASAQGPIKLTDRQLDQVIGGGGLAQTPVDSPILTDGSDGPSGANQFSLQTATAARTNAATTLNAVTVEGYRPVRSVLEIRHAHVVIQKWDLSCGSAALGTLLRYQFGEPVTEKEIAQGLMSRPEYVGHPELVQAREGFSLFDLKRYMQNYREGLYKGEGLGQLEYSDLLERAPLMVPVNALGYNHFVVFRGVMGDRVLLADPAWGNRTMTIDKFQRMWLDYGKPMGHVGFAVAPADGRKVPNRLQPKPSDFVTFG